MLILIFLPLIIAIVYALKLKKGLYAGTLACCIGIAAGRIMYALAVQAVTGTDLISYYSPVALSDGEYSLRVPLVAAPRYTPAGGAPSAEGRAPLLDPRRHRPVNPVSITVRLRPGVALTGLSSRNHAVSTRNDPAGGKIVSLVGGEVPADRDFELIWRAAPSSAPTVGLFREHVAGGDYVLAQVTPPIAPRKGPPVPREIVFVIDNSGSMGGTSIRQAKAGLAYGLSRLKPGDRFNVVRFDHTLTVLFPDSVPADAAHLGQAQKFVAGLDAAPRGYRPCARPWPIRAPTTPATSARWCS